MKNLKNTTTNLPLNLRIILLYFIMPREKMHQNLLILKGIMIHITFSKIRNSDRRIKLELLEQFLVIFKVNIQTKHFIIEVNLSTTQIIMIIKRYFQNRINFKGDVMYTEGRVSNTKIYQYKAFKEVNEVTKKVKKLFISE